MTDPLQVLITGATGMIGGAVARRWAALGVGRLGEARITVLVRDPASEAARKLEALGARVLRGDLSDDAAVTAAVRGMDLIVHAAGARDHERSLGARQVQAQAAAALYRAACAAGVGRMLAFSALAFGINGAGWTGDPDTDLRLHTERGLLNAMQPGRTQLVVLRLAPVYGPGAPRWTAQPLERAQQGSLSVPGHGQYALPYVYIENVVDAVTAAAAADACGVYEVFDGISSYAEVYGHYARMAGGRVGRLPLPVVMGLCWLEETQARLLGRAPKVTRDGMRSLLQEMPTEPPTAEKAQRELGWQSRVSLEEGMAAIERSNGFHKRQQRDEVDPWKENRNWITEDELTKGGEYEHGDQDQPRPGDDPMGSGGGGANGL